VGGHPLGEGGGEGINKQCHELFRPRDIFLAYHLIIRYQVTGTYTYRYLTKGTSLDFEK
jgi:hypothetical protein